MNLAQARRRQSRSWRLHAQCMWLHRETDQATFQSSAGAPRSARWGNGLNWFDCSLTIRAAMLASFLKSLGDSASLKNVDDQHHEGDNQENVDQVTRNTKTKSQSPHQQQDHQYGPQHRSPQFGGSAKLFEKSLSDWRLLFTTNKTYPRPRLRKK